MGDLVNPKWMYLKAVLFVAIGITSSALLLIEMPSLRNFVLLMLAIWSFARAYYFAFYVIEHYVDPSFKFAGLGSFVTYIMNRRTREP